MKEEIIYKMLILSLFSSAFFALAYLAMKKIISKGYSVLGFISGAFMGLGNIGFFLYFLEFHILGGLSVI